MNVSELLAQLQDLPSYLPVCISDSEYGQCTLASVSAEPPNPDYDETSVESRWRIVLDA